VQKFGVKHDVCNIVARKRYNIVSILNSFINLYGSTSAQLHFMIFLRN